MNSSSVKISLNKGKEASLQRFHPWVFSGAISKIHGQVQEGDLVEVFDSKDNYLGTGHCQMGSIAVRLFAFNKERIDTDFWKRKFQKAFEFRKKVGLIDTKNTNVYRLFNAEGDGLPGIIVDYFNGTAVFQFHSIGMYLLRNVFSEILRELYSENLKAVYDKSEETIAKKSELEIRNGYLFGEPQSNEILEYDHKFYVDWESGQKTGFFIDQRENRKLLSHYSKGKSVLNAFCYSGGFSVYAAKSGAALIHSVDSSKKAIELTDKNYLLNSLPAGIHQSFVSDVFEFMQGKENQYDIIILDPPAFAKHRDSKHNAIQAYKRLNTEAFRQIKPGGFLFTFSCSQVVDRNSFNSAVMAAAILSGRNVRILHYLSQPPDHPINIFHPEGDYLKGMVLFVE